MIDIFKLKQGNKIKFIGISPFFWFTDMIENAEKNLTIGKVYTVSDKQILSSWTCIRLKETGDLQYSSGWFDNI